MIQSQPQIGLRNVLVGSLALYLVPVLTYFLSLGPPIVV